MKLRTILVDDEPLARERLRLLLADDDEVEIVAECRNGREALEALRLETAELLFLDIQMPGMNGFEVLEEYGIDQAPATIFTTAYSEFAVCAFEVRAVDYLTKPIERPRFEAALTRVKERVQSANQQDMHARIAELAVALKQSSDVSKHMVVRDGSRDVFLKMEEIEWIEAADYYSRLHAGGRTYMLREPMKDLAARLDSRTFLRVHRSVIVNVDHVQETQRDGTNDYYAVLRSGKRLPMNRAGWLSVTGRGERLS